MNSLEKKRLSKEAEQQMNALKRISRWRTMAIGISAIGVPLVYAGFGVEANILGLGILGICLIVIGFICAAILNLGIRNGRRNVGKILLILEEK